MKHPLRDALNRRRFRRVQLEANATGQIVCATIGKGGKPIYFTIPSGADDRVGEAKAFELRHGRKVTQAENMLKLAAEARLEQVAR